MDKKDWKAKAKALEKELEKLLAEGAEAVQGAVEAVKKAVKPVSPLAPASFPALPAIAGAEFAAAEAGVKYASRKDVMLVRLAPGTVMAGAFTRSTTRSACVRDCQHKLAMRVESYAQCALERIAFLGRIGEPRDKRVSSRSVRRSLSSLRMPQEAPPQ